MKRWNSQPAFSLVEVVASLMLVGTLLVACLVAHRRSAEQLRLADRRLEAIAVLDELLEARQRPDAEELQLARGKAPGTNPFYWRSTLRSDRTLDAFGAAVLRMELYDPSFKDGETLSAVEVIAPGGESVPPEMR